MTEGSKKEMHEDRVSYAVTLKKDRQGVRRWIGEIGMKGKCEEHH